MSARLDRYYTLAEAAARLMGIDEPKDVRKLRDRLLRLERAKGRTILTRTNEEGKRTRYLLTLRALRRACPELFEDEDERTARLRTERVVANLNQRLDDIEEQVEGGSIAVRNVAARLSTIAAKVEHLERWKAGAVVRSKTG